MADDKMFDLMSKIYSELQDTKRELQDTKKEMHQGFKEVKGEITANRTEITKNRSAITKLESKIENETNDKIPALYDNRVGVNDKLFSMDTKIDDLQKSVNDLGIKTLVTDNKLIDLARRV